MKVMVPGAGGMVGRLVVDHCKRIGDEVLGLTHVDLDIGDRGSVLTAVSAFTPDVIINCAAWTDVDGCESDPEKASRANAAGPENLALAARNSGAQLITISTDYVFRGDKEGFYTQRDDPDAVSVYGKSKIDGERRAMAACARTSVVRSGWIFGPGGRNFLSRVVELGAGNQPLNSIEDAWGTPTYAVDLAVRLRELADLDLPGIYHVVSTGEGTTFAGFTREIFSRAGFDPSMIRPVKMASLNRLAPRPVNSRLRCLLSDAVGLAPLPHWTDAIKRFVAVQNSQGREACG